MANTTIETKATVNTTSATTETKGKKPTKNQCYDMLLALKAVQENPTLKEFCEHEKELNNKKRVSKKVSAERQANDEYRDIILDLLEKNGPMTITQMQGASTELADFSNQKMSSLLSPMCKNGIVVREVVKKVTTFRLAE